MQIDYTLWFILPRACLSCPFYDVHRAFLPGMIMAVIAKNAEAAIHAARHDVGDAAPQEV